MILTSHIHSTIIIIQSLDCPNEMRIFGHAIIAMLTPATKIFVNHVQKKTTFVIYARRSTRGRSLYETMHLLIIVAVVVAGTGLF